jgi:energy-coupling factor transporter ATP-binding protein EcfA2
MATKQVQTKKDEPASNLSAEQRQEMIALAAYQIAEKRGFVGNHDMDDWLAAEQELELVSDEDAQNSH